MTVISADSFDPLRRYVSVRMQQGVPLVDQDWNEREDARRFAARSVVRTYAADGVALDNDGFRIDATGATNDFTIRAGGGNPADPLDGTGRALAGGGEALIAQDGAFRAQPLHVSGGTTAAALAARLGVPTIAELPPGPGPVLVYLDVWERLVSPAEDGGLVLAGLGVESCARLKREWAVRARPGVAVPAPADGDWLAGHSYVELARITRAGGGAVDAADVVDRRERELQVPPSLLLVDAFGDSGTTADATVAAYRRGANRPPVSYRAALNALLLGHLPGSGDVELQSNATQEFGLRPVADGIGNLVAILGSDRANPGSGNTDLFVVRASLADADAGFDAPVQATSGITFEGAPQLLPLGGGELLLVYTVIGVGAHVAARRGTYPGVATAAELGAVATGTYGGSVVGLSGTTAIFVFRDTVAKQWLYRRLDLTTNTYLGAAATFLSSTASESESAVPALDAAGNVWFAVTVDAGIQAGSMNAAGVGSASPVFNGSGAGGAELPAVAVDPNGDVWVFYDENSTGIWWARLHSGTWTSGFVVGSRPHDGFPQVVVDPAGFGMWLTWTRVESGHAATYLRWYNARTSAWAPPRALTTTTLSDMFATTYLEPDGSLWLVWSRLTNPITFTFRAFLKRVFTRV